MLTAQIKMTPAGLRADFTPMWAARHKAIADARAMIADAKSLPARNDFDREYRDARIHAAYQVLSKAQDRLIGG